MGHFRAHFLQKRLKLLYNAFSQKSQILQNSLAKIAIDGEEIERVSNFEYLGARIEANGKSTPEIRRRLAMATTRLTKMISIWKGQCKKNKTESPRDSGIPNCLVWV